MAAGEEPPQKKVKFGGAAAEGQEVFKCGANDAFTWHLIDGANLGAALKSGGHMFKAEYYNQPFGEAEEIAGYKGLAVDVWVDGATFATWVDVKYESKRPKATDIHAALKEWFPAGYSKTHAEFESALATAGRPVWGELGRLLSEKDMDVEGAPALALRHVKLSESPAWFKALHARLEPQLIFSVDGASFIDPEDEKWELVAAIMDGGAGQLLVGFMTVYNFYAWPTGVRPRVAQVLVLPPYQGAGIGKALLAAAYGLAAERGASDLVFEDPSPELQRAREKLEVEMLLGQEWIASPIQEALAAAAAAPPPAEGAGSGGGAAGGGAAGGGAAEPPNPLALAPELGARITQDLKIHHHHLRSCWEAAVYAHPAASAAAAAAWAAGGGGGAAGALRALVRRRLAEANAAAADQNGAGKTIVEVPSAKEGEAPDFFMWRPRGRKAGGGEAAGGSGASGSDGGGAEGVVSVGRHSITQVDAAEWEERLQTLLRERMAQLEGLRRRLAGEAPLSESEGGEDGSGSGSGEDGSGGGEGEEGDEME
ncbi:MAG: acyl-CoA N-acyltransferase [Monoraphidium minutum]|nr:MAG: acyl-CoA N-acyltransferase [Monoraphidium minutum]